MGMVIRFLSKTSLMTGEETGDRTVPAAKSDVGVRARILDSAVSHFAAAGFSRPGLDEIARAAGVTPEEIVGLYGNEEGLRHECDDQVLNALVGWAREKATLEGMKEVMLAYQADPASFQAQMGYLGRAVAEDTAAAARFIDTLVEESEAIIRAGIADGSMRPSDDPRALAVLLATTVLGMLTMAPHMERALGLPPGSQQQMLLRLALPATEMYTRGLYVDDSYLNLVRSAFEK